jgi:hypothetical protein
LAIEETTWRLKSWPFGSRRGTIIQSFFTILLSHRKAFNTIWELDGQDGTKIRSFKEISATGMAHFETLFREPVENHIVEQMRVI